MIYMIKPFFINENFGISQYTKPWVTQVYMVIKAIFSWICLVRYYIINYSQFTLKQSFFIWALKSSNINAISESQVQITVCFITFTYTEISLGNHESKRAMNAEERHICLYQYALVQYRVMTYSLTGSGERLIPTEYHHRLRRGM